MHIWPPPKSIDDLPPNLDSLLVSYDNLLNNPTMSAIPAKRPKPPGVLNHDHARTLDDYESDRSDLDNRIGSYAEIITANKASTTPSGQKYLNDRASLSNSSERTYKRGFCDQNQVEDPQLGTQHRDDSMCRLQIKQRSPSTSNLKSGDVCLANAGDDHQKPCCDDSSKRDEDEERDKEVLIGQEEVSQIRMKCINTYKDGSKRKVDLSDHVKLGSSTCSATAADDADVNDGDDDDDRKSDVPSQNETVADEHLKRGPPLRSSSTPITPQKAVASCLYRRDNSFRTHLKQGRLSKSPDNRTLRASDTLSADPSYESDVGANERKVRCWMQKPLALADLREEGIVYVLRDEDLGLVKIGSTRRTVEERKKEIEHRCNTFNKLIVVGHVVVSAYKRLEDIIQQDLTPHRWFFHCECGKSSKQGFTRHQEWFELEDDVALRTLNFWASFVRDNPWVQHPLTDPEPSLGETTNLEPKWLKKLKVGQHIQASEDHDNHEARIQRWRDVLGPIKIEVGESLIDHSTTAVAVADHGTTAGANMGSSPDESPSKPPMRSMAEPVEADESFEIHKQSPDRLQRSASSDHDVSGPRTSNCFVPNSQPVQATSLPLRGKQPASDASSLQDAVQTPDITSVEGCTFGAILPRPVIHESRPGYTHQYHRTFGEYDCHGKNHSVSGTDAQLGSNLVPAAKTQQPPAGGGSQWAIPFTTIWSPTSNKSSRQHESLQTHAPETEKRNSKPESQHDHRTDKVSQHQTQPQPTDSGVSTFNHSFNEAILSIDYLLPSLLAFTTKLLAKPTRPLPASTISADLWQLRWPLACFLIFALHSPHIPPALSSGMWIVFLPCFVAELRGW